MNTLLLVLCLLNVGDSVEEEGRLTSSRNVVISTDNGRGSGVILRTNLILTVFHIIENGSDVKVDGIIAKIVKTYPEQDLVLLEVGTDPFKDAPLAPSTSQDDEVIVHTNPLNHTGMTVRGRIIDIDDKWLYTDAHLSSGSSGSGVYNLKKELVGIVVAVEGKEDIGYPYGVIISSSKIKKAMEGCEE